MRSSIIQFFQRHFNPHRLVKLLRRRLGIILIFIILAGLGAYFFYFRNLDRVEFYAQYSQEIQFVKKLSNIVFLPQMLLPTKLERYDLIINPQDWQFLNNNLPELYTGQFLTDEYKKTVSAKFIAQDREFDVKVRYRGDTDVHWRDNKKSWRIDFKDGKYFEGKKDIHLVIPVDRNYLLEELTFYRAKKMGLIVPQTKFVNLFVNGQRQGVYWEFEHWGKEFLEKNNIPSETNLYGSVEFADLIDPTIDPFTTIHAWRKYASSSTEGADNYDDLEQLLEVLNNESDEYFNNNIGKIIDLDNFYAWQINQLLMSSTHQTGSNMRFYFDPTIGKFKFIAWDVSLNPLPPALHEENYNRLITRILKNPEFLHERNKKLWQYVGNDDNLADDLAFYNQLDELTKLDFYKDTRKVESNFAYRKKIDTFKEEIIKRIELLKNNLKDTDAVITVNVHSTLPRLALNIGTSGFSAVSLTEVEFTKENCDSHLTAYNQFGQPLALFDCDQGVYTVQTDFITYSKREDLDQQFMIPSYNESLIFIISDNPADRKLFTNDALKFTARNAVTGKKIKKENVSIRFSVGDLNFKPISATNPLDDFIKINPIFSLVNNNLELRRGSYVINRDIIIPEDTRLIIDPGTIIYMGNNSSLLSYSPISAQGNALNPITIRGLEDSLWGVIGIIGDLATSTFDHVIMNGGSDDLINGIFMSGMLSAYHSPIVISNSQFNNAHGDDGINIKYGLAEISNSQFVGNDFDGLDLDATDSIVTNNIFIGNGNDGIDISANKPIIKNNKIENSGDKCISIGENSQAIIFNNLLSNCIMGIAVKDLSNPLIINNTIINNEVGIAGYQKKEFFGGSSARVINSIIWDNDKAIELDQLSTIDISHSIVTEGYPGRANTSLKPSFDSNFVISQDDGVNQNLNSEIYFQFNNILEPKKVIGYTQ